MPGRPAGRPTSGDMIPDEVFAAECETIGLEEMARRYGMSARAMYRRRRKLELKLKRSLTNEGSTSGAEKWQQEVFPGRLNKEVKDGVVVVAGDAHYWPLPPPLMHRALVKFITEFRQDKVLRGVVINGDVLDFSVLSRFPHVNWEKRPDVKDEIETAVERMYEIEVAAGKAWKVWTLGNHDARLSIYIASHAKELEGLPYTQLKDFFPLWEPCWRIDLNDSNDTVTIKHRAKSSMRAAEVNVDDAGTHFITNHTHRARVVPVPKHNGTLYGVETGCLAECYGPQFLYLEDNPRRWTSAFCVLTFRDGKLLMPELVIGLDKDTVQFRGKVYRP